MIKLLRCFSLLLLLGWLPQPAATATSGLNTKQKIERVKQERLRLARVKKQLQAQLGHIGRELHQMDAALITARRASRQAYEKVLKTDQQLLVLQHKSGQLQQRISILKQMVLDQAIAAWQHSSHASPWMGVLAGISVSDIPHRRFLLNEVMRSEQRDRDAYSETIAELAGVEMALHTQRQQLELFRKEKKTTATELAAHVTDKRKMIEHGQQSAGVSIRRRKGHLKWPIRGRIVASYRSRPKAGMPRLQGVQLRPKNHARSVQAMAAGQVRYADWFGGYGLMTIIDYGDGLLGVYAHNNALYKQIGDWVEEGDIIADAGSTGWVNKVTLYFEVRDRGKAVNPKRWCRR